MIVFPFFILLLTIVVIAATTILQLVPLVLLAEYSSTCCPSPASDVSVCHGGGSLFRSLALSGESVHCYRVISMWGYCEDHGDVEVCQDGAEPKTEITSLFILGAAVLLGLLLAVTRWCFRCPQNQREMHSASKVYSKIAAASSAMDEGATDGKNSSTVSVQDDSSTATCSVAPVCVLLFVATVMLVAAVWCFATFREKWTPRYGDVFLSGYYILTYCVVPVAILIWCLLTTSLFFTCLS